jgi:hypothetical protein
VCVTACGGFSSMPSRPAWRRADRRTGTFRDEGESVMPIDPARLND